MKRNLGILVPREKLPDWAQFLASLSDHPIIQDEQGTLRFQANPFVDYLYRKAPDLNGMVLLYQHGVGTRDQFMQLYRDLGYSLAGFYDVWGEVLDEMEGVAEVLTEKGGTL